MSNPTVILFQDDAEVELPAKYVVCPRCEGCGSHVNPSIDGNGLTREDFDEDPDFKESYFRGDYDVTCYECKGQRVVAVVDPKRCGKQHLRAYRQQQREAAEVDAVQDAERRAELGWHGYYYG